MLQLAIGAQLGRRLKTGCSQDWQPGLAAPHEDWPPHRLLLTEGAHWVETSGAAGRKVAGGGRDQQQHRGGGQEQRVVGGAEGEEHGTEGSGGGDCSSGAEQDPDRKSTRLN